MKLTAEEQVRVEHDLEERADYIGDEELRKLTAKNDFFNAVQKKLLGRGTKLIVGPRGCGKTHMMRFAQLESIRRAGHPFAIYVSFNRYYRLEPMLQSKPDAVRLFQVWTLANAVLATLRAVAWFSTEGEKAALDFADTIRVSPDELRELIARLEVSAALGESHTELADRLAVTQVIPILEDAARFCGRKRCILLLDDAALTLTPEYLEEFFDFVRSIKSTRISPKVSIYPSTEYGSRFHAVHESEEIPVWLSPDDPGYERMMNEIAALRFPDLQSAPAGVPEQLRFAAFGIPRAYLSMLRQFIETRGRLNTQPALNRAVDDHMSARIAEFKSLAKKVPKFESLVRAGHTFFTCAVDELTEANKDLTGSKQLMLGLIDEPTKPLVQRMLGLLIEAGLLYEHQSVVHGGDRRYRRFTPHLAALMQQKAFSGRDKGVSPGRVVEHLRRKSAKHPIRRSLETLLPQDALEQIELSLPPCQKCKQPRLNDTQKFCHSCGNELMSMSAFANYMNVELADIPGFTRWQRERIAKFKGLNTIGDLFAHRDPGSELRKIPWVGEIRAKDMLALVNAHVDEFFS